MAGYNYGSEYPGGYNPSYGNPYSYMPNPSYGGYPQQYNAAYGQGFDQAAYGMAQGGQSAANTTTASAATKGTDASVTQMAGGPSSQYPYANYAEAGYQGAYNYSQSDYANAGGAGYMGYGNAQAQGTGNAGAGRDQGSKHPSNQAQSPSQGGSYPKSGQSEVGPVKGKE